MIFGFSVIEYFFTSKTIHNSRMASYEPSFIFCRNRNMPVCQECEGTDFDERDGLYFCQICMTQSQVRIIKSECVGLK